MGSNPPEKSESSNNSYLKRLFTWAFARSPPLEGNIHQRKTIIGIYPPNFVLGATWGAISGYTSRDFFRPVQDKWKGFRVLTLTFMSKHSIFKKLGNSESIYPLLAFTARVIQRSLTAGVVFDIAETKAAQHINSGESSTRTTLAGLTLLALFFRVTNNIRDSVIASSCILGSYAIGSLIGRLVKMKKTRILQTESGSGGGETKA